MDRPHIICHMMTSLDGKIMGAYMDTQVAEDMNNEYDRIHDEFQADAWMCGRVTMDDNFTFYKEPALEQNVPELPRTDYVAQSSAESYVVAVDPSGKLGWTANTISGYAKRPPAHIIEAVTDRASNAYLAFLRNMGISYVFAGAEQIDCALLAEKLYRLFPIRRLLLEGGGVLNGAFLHARLVDELSIVLAATADGSTSTPTLFDVPKGLPDRPASLFSLEGVMQLGEDGLWLRYTVKR